MGYMLQQVMHNLLSIRGIVRTVATVVTQVVVDETDPAFDAPSKPIGPFYTQERADRFRTEKGWQVVEDAGRGYRRVVPSPIPREVVEIEAIRALLEAGTVVIAAGGGGIPVARSNGILKGVEAVVDKDHASSLLAREIGADLFLIATGVEKVYLDYESPDRKPLDRLTVEEAEGYLREGQFPDGSMGPKMTAAIEYLRNGGKEVLITDVSAVDRALRGETGTRIVP
jgi:carbamate kinase